MEITEFCDNLDGAYLEHHGVKGQKWGVHRAQKSSGGGKRGGSSKGSSNERVKGGVLSNLASNKKVRIAAGIAAVAIAGVAAYAIAGPQIAAFAASGAKAVNDYLDTMRSTPLNYSNSNKSMPTLAEAYQHLSNPAVRRGNAIQRHITRNEEKFGKYFARSNRPVNAMSLKNFTRRHLGYGTGTPYATEPGRISREAMEELYWNTQKNRV